MIPTHYIYSVVPVALVPLASQIVVALSGNQSDLYIYSVALSETGNAPTTHYLAGAPCSDDFLAKVQYFTATPAALAATAGIPLELAQNYCTNAKLFEQGQREDAIAACGLKVIVQEDSLTPVAF